jgi:hypothetical protein
VVALLLAATLGGCSSSLLSHASIDAPAFDVSPDRGDATTTFHVDAGSWADGASVTWDFGDGATATGRAADHKYGFTNGAMTITLLATQGGKQGVATRTITLGTGVNAKPTLSMYAARSWIEVGKSVALNAHASDADGDPLALTWTTRAAGGPETILPGGASTATASFDKPGKYAVTVRARDPKGGEAEATETLDVSKRIPDPSLDLKWNGTLVAGTGGQKQASEQAWIAPSPVPDTDVDAARHFYTLKYPASTVVFLVWNDTSTQGFWDLDLELRNATSNQTIFKSEHHVNPGPPPVGTAPFEYNFTQQPPGDYVIVVRAITGVKFDYTLLLHSSLQLTPELVAQTET